jgi:hypothetical protein
MGALTDMPAGSIKGLHLVVEDIVDARETLLASGVAVNDVEDMGGVSDAWFSDPDGNLWTLRQWATSHKSDPAT